MTKSKIKQRPEDFLVEEMSRYNITPAGRFSIYLLEKRSWTTHDAIFKIRRTWEIPGNRLSYGGLKDKHALTRQYFSIDHGPEKGLNLPGIRVVFLGHGNTPYTSQDFDSNQFQIILRNIGESQIKFIPEILKQLPACGVPNYFDDQRFGSVNLNEKDFIAKHLVLGDFETALKNALTKTFPSDSASEKKEKKAIVDYWGKWKECKDLLGKGHARSLVDYLVHHPLDFKGAMERMRVDLATMYLSAYQSYLWNEILARWILAKTPTEHLYYFELKTGKYPAPTLLPQDPAEDPASNYFPLPSSRLKMLPSDPLFEIIQSVFQTEGFPLEQMKIPRIKKWFFSKGERLGFFRPANMQCEIMDDELNKGKKAARFSFELPKGCYATMVIKCIQSWLTRG